MQSLQLVLPVFDGQQRRICDFCNGQMRLARLIPHPTLAGVDIRQFDCMACPEARQFLSSRVREAEGA